MSDQGSRRVLVIGGGVIGLSVAFHCAEAGFDVTVVERGELGAATTGQTARVVRAYFPGRVEDSRLAAASLDEYLRLDVVSGVAPDLAATGFMVAVTKEADVDRLEQELDAQRAVGVVANIITAAEAGRRNPWLDTNGLLAAIWSPQAFSCSPEAIVKGYATAARQRGARFLLRTAVTGIDLPAGRVDTTAGPLHTDFIVCAAGPWSGDVANLAGIGLPVAPRESELMITDPVPDRTVIPFTLHLESALRVRRLQESFLIGLEGVPKQGSDRPKWHRAVATEFAARYPRLAGLGLRTAWTGTLDVANGRTAYIGAEGRFLYAAGFSGRGLCQAPAAGRIVRDLCLGAEIPDLSRFSINRPLVSGATPNA
ncbi:4-methylaminobutanoate oxidase (formaldehyde-forming) [Micromonospora sp. MH33]|uniref:NAD(P)/FAD-dependent oxidoreductase n=1 Tax=Micromonospora sp. MH33 TaxID=1945509 RepID=UPI000D148245|nr:FAD-dependent oxidoreductase [Micromonospora sp. MH33]PSK67296.1 4-methylaminobutanoate oxidase (formaldehyde-forming) [Micromonospora sp. MH33]